MNELQGLTILVRVGTPLLVIETVDESLSRCDFAFILARLIARVPQRSSASAILHQHASKDMPAIASSSTMVEVDRLPSVQ